VRRTAAAETRDRVIAAATELLRSGSSIAEFSLDGVAKAAGVTRLTVYNQFGSRRGLLETVFDGVALRGGLTRIPEAVAIADPYAALDRLIEIFCAFWSQNAAMSGLHEAMSLDPDYATAITARNERRRQVLAALVERIAAADASARVRKDAIDLMFTLTSHTTFASLRARRSADAACRLIKQACHAALQPLAAGQDER
jgi:AcrR family transcriptional regulator